MEKEKPTSNDIATALTNLCEKTGVCDQETAKGLKTSKKKEILKSKKDGSFSKFTKEIKKTQTRKD